MSETPSGPNPTMSGPVLAGALRSTASRSGLLLPVEGCSMGRSIRSGSNVEVVATSGPPAAGEVWAFCADDGRVVVHRCLDGAGPPYRFQGDRSPAPDAPVTADRLIGRVASIRVPGRRAPASPPPAARRDTLLRELSARSTGWVIWLRRGRRRLARRLVER